jgi:ABC-type polysaccharide/polyol phosphate transport system ATPase subunit
MGFHPDFTGWENAIMSCRMAGLNKEQIRNHLPEIEHFSELVIILTSHCGFIPQECKCDWRSAQPLW